MEIDIERKFARRGATEGPAREDRETVEYALWPISYERARETRLVALMKKSHAKKES